MLGRLIRKIKTTFFPKPLSPKNVSFWIDKILGDKARHILQIGSNDGKTGDPLFRLLHNHLNWQATFVEPIPYLFDRLKENYRNNPKHQYIKAAISEQKALTFYSVDPAAKQNVEDLPYWFDQLGSFNREHITKHLDGKLEPYIKEMKVRCLTLEELFDEAKVTELDLLHVDTEGYDWNILSTLNLDKMTPQIILFEHHHLTESEINLAIPKMATFYEIYLAGIDLFCVRKSANTDIGIEQQFHKITNPKQLISLKNDFDNKAEK